MVGQERADPMATTVGQSFAMIEQSFIALADAMPGRWCMNRSWPATIPAPVGHLPMAYDAGLPR